MYREIGDKRGIAITLNDLGNVAFEQEKYGQAKELFEESLVLSRELGNKKDILSNILGLAGIQDIRGYYKPAVKLLGTIK